MANDNLTIVLDGEVPLHQFSRTIQRFYKLVKALSQEFGKPDIDWIIDDLQISSAIATVRAHNEPEAAEEIVNAYADIGAAFEASVAPRVSYSRPVIKAATRVVAIDDTRVKAVRFETPIRESTVRMIPGKVIPFPSSSVSSKIPIFGQSSSPLVIAAAPSFGGIQGRVQALSNRGALRFTVYDLLYDKAIGCYVAEEKKELLRDVWGKMAIIEGIITRDPVNGRPLSIRQVSNITPLPDPLENREYERARGCAPSLTGLSPEDAIRRIRDAQ